MIQRKRASVHVLPCPTLSDDEDLVTSDDLFSVLFILNTIACIYIIRDKRSIILMLESMEIHRENI